MPRPSLQQLSIRTKIIAMVAGTLLVTLAITALLIRNLVAERIVSQKITIADILTTSILHDIKYSGSDPLRLEGQSIIAKYMTYYRDITTMRIYDSSTLLTIATSDPVEHEVTSRDPEILGAARSAKPSLHAFRQKNGDLEIRSVAPILRGSRITGVLEVHLSIRDLKAALAAVNSRIAAIMAVNLALISLALFVLLRRSILLRLTRLINVTQSIAAGHYDIHVDDAHHDEIGALAHAFNTMTRDLKASKQEIENHNRELQHKVQEATAEVSKAYDDLKNAQSQLVLNEKMASLGVLISGIAHEINTPVGAILNVSRTLDRSVRGFSRELGWLREQNEVPFETILECLESLMEGAGRADQPASYREIRAIEEALQQAGVTDYRDKAAVLARLNFTDVEQVRRYASCFRLPPFLAFAEPLASIAQAAKISETSSQKIGEIVRALKYYAYFDKDRVDRIQINESIQTALVLLRNQLKHAVTLTTEYDSSLPPLSCTSDIHQVWTNLVTNALDAVAERSGGVEGKIAITTRLEGTEVVVRVVDNGCGVPPHIQGKIFDPFFTTKDIGKGTGLGLCIAAGIVKKHGGTITLDSKVGATTFQVRLPVAHEPDVTAESEAA